MHKNKYNAPQIVKAMSIFPLEAKALLELFCF